MNVSVLGAQVVGNRKLGVVYTVLGMVFAFVMVRSLLPLWVVDGAGNPLPPLDDIPYQCAALLGGVPAAFFGVNLWGKFSPRVSGGDEPS